MCDREDTTKRWEAGERTDRKYRKLRKLGYEELDRVVWEWFKQARAKNIPVSGKLIQEHALMYATDLGHASFTASNGWLEKWQKCHNVMAVYLERPLMWIQLLFVIRGAVYKPCAMEC